MESERKRSVIGDCAGTSYGMSGDRQDWQLSLFRSGSYIRKVISSRRAEIAEEGVWTLAENDSVLLLTPKDGERSRWTIHDVTGCEFASTLLVLRWLALASRNLPILLYRIHPRHGGPPIPVDAHGFSSTNP